MNLLKIKKILLIIFFLSGLTALIYEVVWMRMLAIIFGATTTAVSTVLAVFMGGLALGSFFWGRLAEKSKFPLLHFGFLELGIGLYSLFIPFMFEALIKFYPRLYNLPAVKLLGLGLARFFLCSLILCIPTILMGGTFPVISKFYAHQRSRQNKDVSALYGINNLGAVLGAILSGFVLIYYLGVKNTIFLASGLNIFIGLSIFMLFSANNKVERQNPQLEKEPQDIAKESIRPFTISTFIPWFSFFSGIAAFVYQVCFSRALALFFGTSVYAISTVLASFILGLAIGSFIAVRLLQTKPGAYLFGLSQLRIALGAALFLAVYIKLPAALVWFHSFLYDKFWLFQL